VDIEIRSPTHAAEWPFDQDLIVNFPIRGYLAGKSLRTKNELAGKAG
jgi:hypothetical protein